MSENQNDNSGTALASTASGCYKANGVGKYLCILADPPWEQTLTGKWKRRHKRRTCLPYQTMTTEDICKLPVEKYAKPGCHLWLWTTNQTIEDGFKVMRAWGFTYLAPVHWRKPSGLGNYFVHLTQTLLFGYYQKCEFKRERYKPTIFDAPSPAEHSRKPAESYRLIEAISCEPRLELFARPHSPMFPKLPNWDVWGNEMPESDIDLLRELAL